LEVNVGKPTIGRIVIYREKGAVTLPDYDCAAIITATPETLPDVPAGTVDLTVFHPRGGTTAEFGVKENPSNRTDRELVAGTWRWPERV
jgi:hypothetical protein